MGYLEELQTSTKRNKSTSQGLSEALASIVSSAQAQRQPGPAMGPSGGTGLQAAAQRAAGLQYKRRTDMPGGGLQTINVNGQKWTVAKGAADAFTKFIGEVNKRGYGTTTSGGFNDRDIRGRPGTKSVHAYGRAIDFNAGSNPLGGKSDMPAWMGDVAAKYNIFWGNNFKGRKDPMHFEYLGD